MLIQCILHPLHNRKYLLFFQSPSHNLHSHRQTLHLFSIIVLVRTLCNTIQLLQLKVWRKSVLLGINMRYRDDSHGIVEL